ncbi:MAG: gamma-glutamyl-gamma-aminobutyrate hydrolase family protein [Chloroflexi bacterium]|nr:gamma-glutamyl-gamma-aminobutyrate hydrolase family protein [Chloroflexota bacterium]MYB83733.1 gamma-glutamyl-gamma-aminobutyrate hydrolase family protein [Chloroflexota bacterium]MYF65064.1 gamma-glutamyl-gamma-aminobutyrate hydrolase family protein [Chloroflexota bacterium]MYK33577.1 gamma-glutamyl-gamma-aminobutyrate hydrolase family protein [Chloroflexota bacterium]
MALIGVTASNGSTAKNYVASLESRGAQARVLTPERFTSIEEAMDGVSGLLLTGGGDVDPALYGEALDGSMGIEPERDEMEMALFRYAIEEDMPTLGICRGMQLINVAMGGRLIQDLPGHTLPEFQSAVHQVYVSPGSRFGAIIGAGAIYRTNSRHHQGLKEAQRAPSLMASAYHPEDGIVEALESPEHPWLVGVQCHPERENEVPKSFGKLFEWLAGWAERYEAGDMPR